MNNFCQIWDEEAACSYNSLPCPCEDAKHWGCIGSCHCLECYQNPSNNQSSTSEYNTNCYFCENCQHFHNNEYFEQSGFVSKVYSPNSNEYDLNKQSQYLYGNYDCQTRKKFPIDSFSDRMHPSMCRNKYDAFYDDNIQSNGIFANMYSNVRNGHDQICNTACLSKNIVESTQASLGCGIRVTKSKSDSNLNNKSNTSAAVTKESFQSCTPCDSNPIQMMYRNNKQGMSKSTINQSSMQTIASGTSKPTVKRTVLDNKHRKKVINSGYFEFISPTHSPSRAISGTTSANLCKQHCTSTSIHSSKDALRCGYFEIKEKNYDEHQSKKVSFPELDRIPTKISKEVDTSHLKQSTMIDKCLSAHIKHIAVKTSDKSLSANILTKEWMMSISEVLRVLNKISKHKLHTKRNSKVLESISAKSLTQFKSILSNKPSIIKQKNNKRNVRKKLNSTKSLSEGSIKIGKQVVEEIYSKNENINVIRENGVGYRSYLDNALDKLETQISNKIERALFTYADISNKKQLLDDYNNEIENLAKVSPINETTIKFESLRNEIGTNPSDTMQTLEDVIDSEEVEIDTNDYEERSSLSSHSNSNENKMYSSDVSSHNTERICIVDSTEKSHENETSVQFKQMRSNSTTKQNELRNSNLTVAIVTSNNHHENNLNRNSHESSSQKFGDRKGLSSSKLKDSSKSVTSGNRESSAGPYFSSRGHLNQQLSQDTLRNTNSSKLKDSSKSVRSGNQESSIGPYFSSRGHFNQQLSQDTLRNTNSSKLKDSSKSVRSGNQESSVEPYFPSCEHLNQQLSQETVSKTNSSRNGPGNRNQHSVLSHKQGFDSKVRGGHKNIKFKQSSLGTIQEESHTPLSVIHESDKSIPTSETAVFSGNDSSDHIWDDCVENSLHNLGSSYDIHDTSKYSRIAQRTVSKSKNNISDQVCSQTDYLKSVCACPGYPVDIHLYENDSCCVRQTCRDCPKQRYYAQVLQSYNEKRIRHYHENQNEDPLYKYMLNVPLYSDNDRHMKNQHQPDNKQMKLLNVISFIIFIIMFYGIFQYINVSIQTGTFPWV